MYVRTYIRKNVIYVCVCMYICTYVCTVLVALLIAFSCLFFQEKLPERALHSSPNQPNDPYPANRQLQPRANQPPRQDRPAYIPTHKPPSSVTQDPDTHRLRDGPAYFPTHKPPSPVAQDPDTHRLRGGPVYDQPRHAPLQPIPPFKAGSVPGPAYNQPYAASRQPLATSQNPNSNRSSSYSLPRKPTPMAAMPPSAHRPSSHAAPGQPLALNHVPTAGRLQPAPRYPPPRQDYPAARSPSVPGRPIYDKPQQPLPATSVQPPPLARVPSAPAIIRPNSTPQPQPPQPPPPQPPPNPAPEQVPNTWRVRTQALEQITGSTGQAIAHRKVLYFTQNYIPYAYHEREDRWEELPRCKNKEFAVAIVSDKLTAVGGLDTRGLQSSTIFTLQYRKWERVLPALPRARAHPAALTTPTQHLVVAGGTYVSENSHAGYKEVEVLNLVTKQWFEVSSLPEVARYPQLMLTNNNNILLYDTEKNKLYGCLLDVLLEQAPGGGAWAQQAPVENVKEGASLAQVGDCLLAIGGKDKAGKPCSEIYCYNAQNDMWSYVKDMLTPRSWTLSAVAPGNVLVVVGGFKNQACTLTETIVVDFL